MNQTGRRPIDAWDLDMSESSATPPLHCANMASARLTGEVVDGNTWTNTEMVQLFASVDGNQWVAIGDKIRGGSAADQVSSLIDIRGYNWVRAIVTNKKTGTLMVHVTISLSTYRVDEVHSVPALASPPTDGSVLYYDTGWDCLVEYDEGRGHWFGPLMQRSYGRASSVSDGERLRDEAGSVQVSSARGWITDRSMTCVGIEATSAASFTGSFELTEGTTATGQTVTFTASTQESDYAVDYDWDVAAFLGVRINITSGTPTNPVVTVYNRWRRQ